MCVTSLVCVLVSRFTNCRILVEDLACKIYIKVPACTSPTPTGGFAAARFDVDIDCSLFIFCWCSFLWMGLCWVLFVAWFFVSFLV